MHYHLGNSLGYNIRCCCCVSYKFMAVLLLTCQNFYLSTSHFEILDLLVTPSLCSLRPSLRDMDERAFSVFSLRNSEVNCQIFYETVLILIILNVASKATYLQKHFHFFDLYVLLICDVEIYLSHSLPDLFSLLITKFKK